MQRLRQALCLSSALIVSAGGLIVSGNPHPLKIEKETVVNLDGAATARSQISYALAPRAERAVVLRLYPIAPASVSDFGKDSEIAARTPKALVLPRT